VTARAIAVRRATRDDVPAIVELWKEFMDFHADRDPIFTRAVDGHQRFAEFITEEISADESVVHVAVQGERLVGYCLAKLARRPAVFRDRWYGSISDLAVTERLRRRGLGQLLLAATREWFVQQGVTRIELLAAVANTVSTGFWEKLGFRPYLETLFLELAPSAGGRAAETAGKTQ